VYVEDARDGTPIPGSQVFYVDSLSSWGGISNIQGVAEIDTTRLAPTEVLRGKFIGYALLQIPFAEIRKGGPALRMRLAPSSNGWEAINFGEHFVPPQKQTVSFKITKSDRRLRQYELTWADGVIRLF
jgi:hypothetical protein